MSIVALLLALAVQQTPGVLRARVTDATTGQPIAGAQVTIAGARGASITDAEGRFVRVELPPLPFDLVVMLPDGRVARTIRIDAIDPARERSIVVDPLVSAAVTVRGSAPGVDAAPGAASVAITAADLATRHNVTLAQAIADVTGVSAISEGQGATPAIRGLARGRSLILVDGARVSTERGAGPNASFLDPATLSRIDVARGPASVAYGTDALGGIIAARTRQPEIGQPFSVRFATTGARGAPERHAHLELSHGYRTGGVLVGARIRELMDYSSPFGPVPYSSWTDAGGRVAWAQAFGSTRVVAGAHVDEATDIGRPRSDSNSTVLTSPFERSQRITIGIERPNLAGWRDVRFDVSGGQSNQRVEQDRLAAPGRPRRLDRTDSSARDAQARITARRTAGPVRLHAGVDVHRRFDVSAEDIGFIYNNAGALTSTVVTPSMTAASRTSAGLFLEGTVSMNRQIRLTGGIRGGVSRNVNEGGFFGDRVITHQPAAGLVAVVLQPRGDVSITAQFARGFREPTLTDRFSRGPVGRGFIEGNPDLLPETSRQWDVTAAYTKGRAQLSAAVYRYDVRDLIERYAADADLFRLRNRSRSHLQGVEIEARLEAPRGFTIDISGHLSRGRDAVDDTPLDDIAPNVVALTVRHAWRDRVWSYVRAAGVSRHRDAGPTEVPTPGYTLIDAGANWRVAGALTLRATMRNALDAAYYSSAGPRWVWAAGRQLSVTAVVTWPR